MKEIMITSSVLILCIMLIRVIFKGKISSRLQYALWLLVALRLIVPTSAQISLAVGSLEEFRIMDLVEMLEARIGDVTDRLDRPVSFTMSINSEVAERAAELMLGEDIPSSADGPTSVFLAGRLGPSWMDVLRRIWFGGIGVVAVWMIVTNMIFRHKLRKDRKEFAIPEELEAILYGRLSLRRNQKPTEQSHETVKKNRLKNKPKIYTAEQLASPCLYGLPGREAIYLTPEVAEDRNKLRHVLTHELCHRKHGDSFWSILRSILTAVYWMNPLVWAAAVLSKRDCELACDEEALLMLGEEERIPYGETLLSIITRKSRLSDIACTATTMTGSGRSVKERIKYIAEKPRALGAAVVAVLVLILIVSVLVFTKSPMFHADTWEGEITLTVGDLQVRLPETIAGISGYDTEMGEGDSIVIYHAASGKEVGRFSVMSYGEAVLLLEEGREVVPLGDYGRNPYLREYMNSLDSDISTESATQHSYTPADESEGVSGTDSVDDNLWGIEPGEIPTPNENDNWMQNEDWEVIPLEEETDDLPDEQGTETATDYLPNERDTGTSADYLPNERITETATDYLPNEQITESTNHTYTPADSTTTHNYTVGDSSAGASATEYPSEGIGGTEPTGVPGTDSNSDDTTYILEDESASSVPIEESTNYVPVEQDTHTYQPIEEDTHTYQPTAQDTEIAVNYLSDEQITTVKRAADNACYVYVKADYSKIKDSCLEEMEYINSELEAVTGQVIVLSINRQIRRELFATLARNRTEYLGDAPRVSALVNALPLPAGLAYKDITLHTLQTDPETALSLDVNYQLTAEGLEDVDSDMMFFNAVMLFATIRNVEECHFIMNPSENGGGADGTYFDAAVTYFRTDWEEKLGLLWSDADADHDEDYAMWLEDLYARVVEQLD